MLRIINVKDRGSTYVYPRTPSALSAKSWGRSIQKGIGIANGSGLRVGRRFLFPPTWFSGVERQSNFNYIRMIRLMCALSLLSNKLGPRSASPVRTQYVTADRRGSPVRRSPSQSLEGNTVGKIAGNEYSLCLCL